MSVSTARVNFRRPWPCAASTRLRPQRPRPTIAQWIMFDSPGRCGRGRIASMMAALSLSPPFSAIAARSSPACVDVIGSAEPARSRLIEDQFGVLQGLRNMRLRRKIPRQHLFSLGVHHARIGGGLARGSEESSCIEAEAFGEDNAFRQRRPVVLQDQIDRELGAAGIADLSDIDPPRTENVEDSTGGFDCFWLRRQSAPWPSRRARSALVPDIGASTSAIPAYRPRVVRSRRFRPARMSWCRLPANAVRSPFNSSISASDLFRVVDGDNSDPASPRQFSR